MVCVCILENHGGNKTSTSSLVRRGVVTSSSLWFTTVVLVATEWLVWIYGQWAMKCTVVTVWSNKHGCYQLSFSKGLAESDGPAVHQHTTLLSHITVTALRPEGKVEERRDRVTTPNERSVRRKSTVMDSTGRLGEQITHQMLGSSSPWRLESKSSRSTACLPWSSTVHTYTICTVKHNLCDSWSVYAVIILSFYYIILLSLKKT